MAVVVIAILIGLSLGLFGSGGSILTVPALIYVLHYPPAVAIHMSLAVVSLISLMAALPYWWRGVVPVRELLQLALPGAVGAVIGSYLTDWLASWVQLTLLASLMALAALNMWRRQVVQLQLSHRYMFSLVGGVVGMLTGLIGVGGGFLLVPVLVALTSLEMSAIIGISLSLVFLQSVVGFISHSLLLPQPLDVRTVAWLGGCGAVGSFVGLWLLPKLPQLLLRRGFAVFLMVLALLIALMQWWQPQ